MTKIYLASDHAGFELKEKVKEALQKEDFAIEDLGAHSFTPEDDYPDFISLAAEAVSKDPQNSKAVVFGGSGQAEMMVANKFRNVRCALFYSAVIPTKTVDISGRSSQDSLEIIKLSRLHNDANVLSVGARFVGLEETLLAVKIWLGTPFSEDERHVRRINKIKEIESKW